MDENEITDQGLPHSPPRGPAPGADPPAPNPSTNDEPGEISHPPRAQVVSFWEDQSGHGDSDCPVRSQASHSPHASPTHQ